MLFSMVRFYQSIIEFTNKVGTYYFDDVMAEDFLGKLQEKILQIYKGIIGDDVSALNRLKLERHEINFSILYLSWNDRCISKLLSNHNNDVKWKEFYLAHLVYSWVLYACVNDGCLVTYNHPVEVEESFNYAVTLHGSIKKGLYDFNKELYGKRIDRYYKLRINGRTLNKSIFSKMRKM